MAKRLADVIRDVSGNPVTGATVTVKKVIDDSTIDSVTTGADGKAEFSEAEIGYPGDIYYSATDGDTTRVHAGYSTGQIGTWWASDYVRAMRVMTDGVRAGVDGELNVTANGTNMTLTIANGLAFIYGHPYYQPGDATVTVAANGAGNPRIDLVVIRLYPPGTANEGKIDPAIVQGTAAASPSAPTPTQDPGTVYEIPLRTVLVDPGASAIAGAKLTDARQWTSGPLTDLSVTTAKLAAGAVTPAKMTTGSDFSTTGIAKVLKAAVSPTTTPAYGTLALAELSDVAETAPTDAQVLRWDAATSSWKPGSSTAGDVSSNTATSVDGEVALFSGTAGKTLKRGTLSAGVVKATAGVLSAAAAGDLPTHTHTAAQLSDITATAAELNFTDGVTSAIQTQLDAKFAKTGGTISGNTFVTGNLNASADTNFGTSGADTTMSTFGHLFFGGSSAFSVAAGAAAGTGGSVGASRIRGSDQAGELQVVTGSSGVGTGTLATVTFGAARPDTQYIVMLQPTSINAADLNLSLSTRATGTFDIRANAAPGTGETLNIAFLVIEVVPA